MNEQFNWYKIPSGTQRYTTLTRVQAGNENTPNETTGTFLFHKKTMKRKPVTNDYFLLNSKCCMSVCQCLYVFVCVCVSACVRTGTSLWHCVWLLAYDLAVPLSSDRHDDQTRRTQSSQCFTNAIDYVMITASTDNTLVNLHWTHLAQCSN